MSWITILLALLQLFGPKIVEWLEDLFQQAVRKTMGNATPSSEPATFRREMNKVFDAAKGELGWFGWLLHPRKSAALRLVRRAADRREDEMFSMAQGRLTQLSSLTAEERTEAASLAS